MRVLVRAQALLQLPAKPSSNVHLEWFVVKQIANNPYVHPDGKDASIWCGHVIHCHVIVLHYVRSSDRLAPLVRRCCAAISLPSGLRLRSPFAFAAPVHRT